MNRAEFIAKCTERTTLSRDEIEKTYDESLKYVQERGVPADIAEDTAARRAAALLKRHLTSNAERFEGYVLFATLPTDFGAARAFNDVSTKWAKSGEAERQTMIDCGEVDSTGKPLWNRPGSARNGKPIAIGKGSMQRTVYLVARKMGGVEYEKTRLTLWSDKIDISIPIGEKVLFRANIGTSQDNGFLNLSSASVTEFTPVSGAGKADLKEMATTFFKNHVCDMSASSLKTWHEAMTPSGKKMSNTFVILRGSATNITLTKPEARSNSLTLTDEGADLGEMFSVTCWVPKEIPINFKEGALGIIVIGNTTEDNKVAGRINVNAEAVVCPPEWIDTEVAKPITAAEQVVYEEPGKEDF
jgi:hypothetical protein